MFGSSRPRSQIANAAYARPRNVLISQIRAKGKPSSPKPRLSLLLMSHDGNGAPGRTRTFNQLIKSQLLCQLSYRGVETGVYYGRIIVAGKLIRPATNADTFEQAKFASRDLYTKHPEPGTRSRFGAGLISDYRITPMLLSWLRGANSTGYSPTTNAQSKRQKLWNAMRF
jgi:hypothetical protein